MIKIILAFILGGILGTLFFIYTRGDVLCFQGGELLITNQPGIAWFSKQ
jgi:hypothetical protein